MIPLCTAVKQAARRQGLHATFMTKPGQPNVFSSGWHLHQLLARTEGGQNVLTAGGAVWPHNNKAALCRPVGGPGDNATYTATAR